MYVLDIHITIIATAPDDENFGFSDNNELIIKLEDRHWLKVKLDSEYCQVRQ